MLRAYAVRLEIAILVLDICISAGIFLAIFREVAEAPDVLPRRALALGLVAALAFPIAISQIGLYGSQRRESMLRLLGRLAVAGAFVIAILVATTLGLQRPEWLRLSVSCALAQLAALGSIRAVVFALLHQLRRLGRNYRDVAVVGTGARAAAFRQEVASHPEWGMRITAFVDDDESETHPDLHGVEVHKISDFPVLVRSQVVDEVVLAIPRSMLSLVAPVVGECARIGAPVTLLSDVFGDYLPPPRETHYGSFPALRFSLAERSRMDRAVKRLIDIVGASVLLVLSSPVIAAAALAVRLGSPGPVLFRQTRCGLYGRRFDMLKLRSMVVDAESHRAELLELNEMDGPVFKIHDDPRVTPAGRFLRRWSIDELPQIWNVLVGDMSLVGPRPPIPEEVTEYRASERRRLSMRPGLTCLWQVSGRNTIGFDDWVKLDLQYIDTWSLGLDLWILLRTPAAVLRRTGAS